MRPAEVLGVEYRTLVVRHLGAVELALSRVFIQPARERSLQFGNFHHNWALGIL
jgi:hypothetical protein